MSDEWTVPLNDFLNFGPRSRLFYFILFKVVTELKKILRGKNDGRYNDMLLLDEYQHTGHLEVANSLHNKYCPKQRWDVL